MCIYTRIYCSVAKLYMSLWDTMNCSKPGFPALAQTHVHSVSDAKQTSHPLSPPSPALSLSQHQGLLQWIVFFTAGSQTMKTSAPVLPVNIQGWFPLGLTGLTCLQSKRLSRVFSSTTVWKHQFFSAQPSLLSNSDIHKTTGKPSRIRWRAWCDEVTPAT